MRSATKYGGGRSSAWLGVENSEKLTDQLSLRSQFLDVPAGFAQGRLQLYVTALTLYIANMNVFS